MSLAAFQRAFADLAASPAFVEAVRRTPAAALAGRDLTRRERDRLAHIARQRGMEAQCSLYRITRLAALNSVLPLTLAALRPVLRPLVDFYWSRHPVHDVRFAAEARRFLAFLASEPALLARAAGPATAAVFDLASLELAVEDARLAAPASGEAQRSAEIRLGHSAAALLAAAPGGLPALAAVPQASTVLLLVTEPGEAPQLFETAA
ncbi:hypothetical protein [Thermaurantiacus sp.]